MTQMERTYIAIDLKSFYSSVECHLFKIIMRINITLNMPAILHGKK